LANSDFHKQLANSGFLKQMASNKRFKWLLGTANNTI
jgi:hypothetical protein